METYLKNVILEFTVENVEYSVTEDGSGTINTLYSWSDKNNGYSFEDSVSNDELDGESVENYFMHYLLL